MVAAARPSTARMLVGASPGAEFLASLATSAKASVDDVVPKRD
jgi:hypothetical protein